MKPDLADNAAPSQKLPILLADDSDSEVAVSPEVVTIEDNQDEVDDEKSERGSRSYDLPGPWWKGVVFALLPIVVIMFGAGREAWSKGVAVMLMSLFLLIFSPQRKLPLFVTLSLLAALLAPLLAFLPSGWLETPAWRKHLTDDWGVNLSSTLTPQSWVTFEAWLFFAVCILWLAWCLTRGFSNDQRRAILQTLTLGGVVLCLSTIFEKMGWISMPMWPRNQQEWGDSFGPFANRNHISSLSAMICILCAGMVQNAHRRKSRLWILFALCIFPPLICIFINTSKAGVILLFIGMTIWLGTSAMREGFFKKMALTAAFASIIATLLVVSGGGVSARFHAGDFGSSIIDPGARWSLFVESINMTLHAPWLGIGLGNFECIFPQITALHVPSSRFLHPESDLLWLLTEGGLLTLIPCLLILMWIVLATGPWFGRKKMSSSNRLDRKLRNSAAIAFGIGALHGLGDVPSHGLGFAMFMALLAGTSIRPRRLKESATVRERWISRLAGLGALWLGFCWISVSLGHPLPLGKSAAMALRSRAQKLASSGSTSIAMSLMNQSISMSPMDFRLYYDRACIRLLQNTSQDEALLDFSRSRALDPQYAPFCYTEGVTWLDYNPQNSIVGWREFLRRNPTASSGIYGYYRAMLNHASQHLELREPLWHLATTSDLKLDFLESVRSREEFDMCLRSLLLNQPQLDGLGPAQRQRVFAIWLQFGDQKALMAALETKPKWRNDGWQILAEYYAQNSDFQRACQTAIPYLTSIIRSAPGTSSDIPALERAMLYNPEDSRSGIDLFQAQKNTGNIDGALRTLEKVATNPNAPTFVRQEIAALYIMKQDFRRAWEHLREAIQKR